MLVVPEFGTVVLYMMRPECYLMKAMVERLTQSRKRRVDHTLVSPWNRRVSDGGQVEGLLSQQRERSRVEKKTRSIESRSSGHVKNSKAGCFTYSALPPTGRVRVRRTPSKGGLTPWPENTQATYCGSEAPPFFTRAWEETWSRTTSRWTASCSQATHTHTQRDVLY